MTYQNIYDCSHITSNSMQNLANAQLHGLFYDDCMRQLDFCELYTILPDDEKSEEY